MYQYQIVVDFNHEGKEVGIVFKPLTFPNPLAIGDGVQIATYNVGQIHEIDHQHNGREIPKFSRAYIYSRDKTNDGSEADQFLIFRRYKEGDLTLTELIEKCDYK